MSCTRCGSSSYHSTLAASRQFGSSYSPQALLVKILHVLSLRACLCRQRLFGHLREAWPTGPRTMVDLGCHAGHGPHMNVSDALLWLDVFHEPGGLVSVSPRAQSHKYRTLTAQTFEACHTGLRRRRN